MIVRKKKKPYREYSIHSNLVVIECSFTENLFINASQIGAFYLCCFSNCSGLFFCSRKWGGQFLAVHISFFVKFVYNVDNSCKHFTIVTFFVGFFFLLGFFIISFSPLSFS